MDNKLKETLDLIKAALVNKPAANFSKADVQTSALNALKEASGIVAGMTTQQILGQENSLFALIDEAVDEVLPQKLNEVMGEFADVRTFGRTDEVVFHIDDLGKERAKLTITRGARAGIYRAARLDSVYFSVPTYTETAAIFVTLEELLSGRVSLSDLFTNILEGFEEIIYREVFNSLAKGEGVAGYNAETPAAIADPESLPAALDSVLPIVKQYGTPTIFGSFKALSQIANPVIDQYYNPSDSNDVRTRGFVQMYKGVRVVELPNYLIGTSNDNWFYNDQYVFVVPAGVKPVKVALKGDTYIQKNTSAVGSEKWEAHRLLGVGLAMANSYAVITITSLAK